MAKPYGRKTRQMVGEILQSRDRKQALDRLAKIPDMQLVGHLFSHFYTTSDLIRFRSITAMGLLGKRLAAGHMENARNLMRRLMWNLNDESGGIGWGSAEAMGEIMGRSPALAEEYASILFSFLDPKANYIDNPLLQQGVLWGIGTCVSAFPDKLTPHLAGLIGLFLDDRDETKKIYAVRALAGAGPLCPDCLPGHILADTKKIQLYTGWHFELTRICDLARSGGDAQGQIRATSE
ncbi:MAG: hypothetical protein V2J08_06540 [Desulfotignum sp.]|jgi:hypothetical protein|nr:hypothetical protein [Desulfotignum sp.]